MEKPKVLVTGGAGFIGSNFSNINKDKYDIVVLDNLLMGDPDNIEDKEKIKYIKGDACEIEDLQKCGNSFDYVIHLAGTSTAPLFMDKGFVDGYVNSVKSFVRALEYARESGAKKFLYASTSSLYGNNPVPLTEDQHVVPPNHYSVTKQLYENCSACYQKVYSEMDIIGFRFMSVYGPNEEAKGPFANIISQFIWDIVRGRSPIIYGDGSQYRDFTNVRDVVQGLTLAIETKEPLGNEVFNIGTGEYASLKEIAEMINIEARKHGIEKLEPEHIPNPVKEGYVKSQCADISKISRRLGYNPNVKLKEGISEQVANVKKDKIRKTSSDLLREKKGS
ncbi:MAG: NAD-dependent epimerase/dehydratase family protein [Parcubacteria group bacterium]|jgi:UDP-glucose 4-epimerase